MAKRILLKERPDGIPGRSHFTFEEFEPRPLQEGEIRLKNLLIAVDVYLRSRMNEKGSSMPAFKLNEPIRGGAIAEVVESRDPLVKVGEKVTGIFPWATEFILDDRRRIRRIQKSSLPLSYHLGANGFLGYTAYLGMLEICKPQKGETVVVSSAAGTVGSLAGQIAKIHGAKVIGIAGSDEKIKVVTEEFGFDAGINYKTTADITARLKELAPEGVHAYFDNVGGDISDQVLSAMHRHGRVALCGQLALYNTPHPVGPRVFPLIQNRSLLVQGFQVTDFRNKFGEAAVALNNWMKQGQVKYRETIVEGFDILPDVLAGLFNGAYAGKTIVKVKE